jgi:hypothetical protein
MLPEGVVADLVSPPLQRQWIGRFPAARVVMTLRRGGCACALTGHRHPSPEEDERMLRTRYRQGGADRSRVIEALERHRRGPRGPDPGGSALAGFVAEHARNAGLALYFLDFSVESERMPPWPDAEPAVVTAAQVRQDPESWLPQQTPILVSA